MQRSEDAHINIDSLPTATPSMQWKLPRNDLTHSLSQGQTIFPKSHTRSWTVAEGDVNKLNSILLSINLISPQQFHFSCGRLGKLIAHPWLKVLNWSPTSLQQAWFITIQRISCSTSQDTRCLRPHWSELNTRVTHAILSRRFKCFGCLGCTLQGMNNSNEGS